MRHAEGVSGSDGRLSSCSSRQSSGRFGMFTDRLVVAAAALSVFGAAAATTLVAPVAGASTDCGLYTPPLNQGSFNLVITQGTVACAQARGVLDDNFAGKGTPTARNAGTVDGYLCTGNPAGIYSETGVLSFCDANGVHFELRKP